MPTYVYRCKSCGFELEEVQKFADEPLVECPSCKAKALVRVIGGAGLVFKGSGFYLTDYKNKSSSESSAAPAKGKSEKGGGGEKSEKGGGGEKSEKAEKGEKSEGAPKESAAPPKSGPDSSSSPKKE